VAAGNVSNGVSHRQNGQSESESDAEQTNTNVRKGGGQDGGTTSTEYKPKSPNKFSARSFGKPHVLPFGF
jgi:hypothetical protein